MRPRLVVMLKEPHPGRVKTRLGRDIGMVAAAWWFRHQALSLLSRIEDPGWETVLAVAPDCAGLESRIWPRHLPRWPQGPGNLGDRMGRLLRHMPPGPVCIIGADIPGIRRKHIAAAFHGLGAHDFMFGPAPDGGYWLVGAKRVSAVPKGLFAGVRWSSEHALSDTIASTGSARIGFVAQLRDVDRAADLE
ncbi:MAG: glycosyltransferase [Paracoccaceae bacterium]